MYFVHFSSIIFLIPGKWIGTLFLYMTFIILMKIELLKLKLIMSYYKNQVSITLRENKKVRRKGTYPKRKNHRKEMNGEFTKKKDRELLSR